MSLTLFKLNPTVGVAPGTTTMQLSGWWNPYPDDVTLSDGAPMQTLRQEARRNIRWDLIGVIGGGSLVIALAAGLIASAIK